MLQGLLSFRYSYRILPCLLTATAHNFHQLVWSSLINSIMGAGFVVGVRMIAECFTPLRNRAGARHLCVTESPEKIAASTKNS